MISWGWLVLASFVGAMLGLVMMAFLVAGATESAYRAGFRDGKKELQKVG
jgi:hypothetical protein